MGKGFYKPRPEKIRLPGLPPPADSVSLLITWLASILNPFPMKSTVCIYFRFREFASAKIPWIHYLFREFTMYFLSFSISPWIPIFWPVHGSLYFFISPWIHIFWPVHGSLYFFISPWIPIFWPVHGSLYFWSVRGSLYFDRYMVPYIFISPWIPI